MADIFVSYSREDKDNARTLITALREEKGFVVFWDEDLDCEKWTDRLIKELDDAKAVIVIWSKNSITSHYVRDEAIIAQRAGKLVAVCKVDEVNEDQIPQGLLLRDFNYLGHDQYEDISNQLKLKKVNPSHPPNEEEDRQNQKRLEEIQERKKSRKAEDDAWSRTTKCDLIAAVKAFKNRPGHFLSDDYEKRADEWLSQREKNRLIHTFVDESADPVTSVLFLHNKEIVLSGHENGSLKVWRYRFGESQQIGTSEIIGSHAKAILSIALAQDGSFFVTAGNDGALKKWDSTSFKMLHDLILAASPIFSVAISQSAEIYFGTKDGMVAEWEVKKNTYREIDWHQKCVKGLACSPVSLMLASGSIDKSVVLWTGPEYTFSDSLNTNKTMVLTTIFSPDGKKVFFSDNDAGIWLWDIKEKQKPETPFITCHGGFLYGLAMSPNGTHLLSGSSSGSLELWDVITPQRVLTLVDEEGSPDRKLRTVNSVSISLDGCRALSGGDDGKLRMWDISDYSDMCKDALKNEIWLAEAD